MIGEFSFFGMYFPWLMVTSLVAIFATRLLSRLLARIGFYRHVWHPPLFDIAMFCVYSMFDKPRTDRLIDLYFADEGGCDTATRAKIYCYAAASGLLWSNWCEYERNLGVEFGAYSLCQYRCAKDYCRYAAELIQKIGENTNES